MLNKIFRGAYLKRLDNIKQWQEMDVFKEESVSQHSYKVGIFCRILLEDIFGENENVKVLKFKLGCMDRALLHDWDEALILRDMSHEVKYNTFNGEKIREVLDELSSHKASSEFKEWDNQYNVPTASSNLLILNICRPDEDVKKFVKLCDWIALWFYIVREQDLGNKNLEEQYKRTAENFYKVAREVKSMLKLKFEEFTLNFKELDTYLIE